MKKTELLLLVYILLLSNACSKNALYQTSLEGEWHLKQAYINNLATNFNEGLVFEIIKKSNNSNSGVLNIKTKTDEYLGNSYSILEYNNAFWLGVDYAIDNGSGFENDLGFQTEADYHIVAVANETLELSLYAFIDTASVGVTLTYLFEKK